MASYSTPSILHRDTNFKLYILCVLPDTTIRLLWSTHACVHHINPPGSFCAQGKSGSSVCPEYTLSNNQIHPRSYKEDSSLGWRGPLASFLMPGSGCVSAQLGMSLSDIEQQQQKNKSCMQWSHCNNKKKSQDSICCLPIYQSKETFSSENYQDEQGHRT